MKRSRKRATKTHGVGPGSTNPTRTRTGESPEKREKPHETKKQTTVIRKDFRDRAAGEQRAPGEMEKGLWEQKALLREGERSMVMRDGNGREMPTDMGTRKHITEKEAGQGE